MNEHENPQGHWTGFFYDQDRQNLWEEMWQIRGQWRDNPPKPERAKQVIAAIRKVQKKLLEDEFRENPDKIKWFLRSDGKVQLCSDEPNR